jgi:hypothetical protein
MRNQALHRFLPKAAWLWLILFLAHLTSFAQTTSISNVVNTYHRVIDVIPDRACVRVSSTAQLNPSRKVMLIQMKGATVNTTNTAAFGDTTSLNQAGNYEIGTICAIRGDSVFLVNTILNNYSFAAGKVQLVQFGEYVSANVTAPLAAEPWNNTTGTGGVIAIFVEQDLTLNEDIDADAKGYAGGSQFISGTSCANGNTIYAVTGAVATTQAGAFKGEGIVDLASNLTGGRGAPANGGGGGNNHNNGGGGGANLSTGGIGGGNSTKPAFGRCSDAFPGLGGKALSSWSGRKIFLGGGGGAGHSNNVSTSYGGNGGGIIFIHASNLIGNNHEISSTGGTGGTANSDGAGGGGGGGTIVLDVDTYTTPVIIKANGGLGGTANDQTSIERCYGAGGGGAGGVIYFSGAVPAVSVSSSAGPAGEETNRHTVGCVAPVLPASGANGQIISGYAYKAYSILAAYCSAVLPVRLEFFKAKASGNETRLNWRLPNPENVSFFIIEKMNLNYEWSQFLSVQAYDGQIEYTAEDKRPFNGYNSYRLKIIEKNSDFFYSPIRRVFVGDKKEPLAIYPNPAINKISIKGNFTGSTDIRLVDISGKLVLHKKTGTGNNTELILPGLTPGIYILHINETVNKLVIR